MQLKHFSTISTPTEGGGLVKVTAVCWAPNGKRLAVCTTDRVVLMFDENGVRKDKFSTKPIEKVRAFFYTSVEILIGCSHYLLFPFNLHFFLL